MSVRVLAVDPKQANLTSLHKRLSAEYFTVSCASSGLEALHLCQQDQFDLVLLSAAMPGSDGFETCHILRKHPATRDVPVLILGTETGPDIRLRALKAGAQDYLPKPVQDGVLISRITNLARQKQTYEDLMAHSTNVFRPGCPNADLLPEPRCDGTSGHILIVDDRVHSAHLLSQALSTEQELRVVPSSEEALQELGATDWDALVINFNLEQSDPLQLLANLKSQQRYRHLPCLAISGNADERRLQKAFGLGLTNYVQAPFSVEELQVRMRREVRQHRLLRKLKQDVENTLELAVTDPLTGLQNRRYLERQLVTLMDQAERYNRALSVMILDIDRFKTVNDQWGHGAGDTVLKEVAHRIRRFLRGSDLACRFGGEEFVCVLSETSLLVAQKAAERLRKEIENHPFLVDNHTEVSVTASFGLTEYLGPQDHVDSLLKRADIALYQAKFSGRNQVVAQAA